MNHHPPGKDPRNQLDSVIPGKHQVMVYLRSCLSTIADAAILLAVTIAAYIAVLYICKVSWHLYLSTPVGQHFAHYFPQTAQSTSTLLQMDLFALSARITLYSFVICITIGSIARFLYLARYLHEQFGVLGRALICGLPLTAVVATYVQPLYGFQEWNTAFMAVILPTLSVFSPCFTYAEKLLPELGDIKKRIIRQ
jgi:hypothetical protein